MSRPAADVALPDSGQVRRRFALAASSFGSASFLHDEARRRLLERLQAFSVAPARIVDAGTALGGGAHALARAFPDAQILAVDSSLDMLRLAPAGTFSRIAGDATRLPLPERSVDLLFANMLLPWMRPEALFAEAARVLSPRGLLVFSTFGPDTLIELRRAWLQADSEVHIHAFWDMQTLGDLAVRAGLEEPVLDVDRINVTYGELSGAIRDLRACGATNTAQGRRRGLTGRGRWQRFVEALWRDQGEGRQARLSLTVELICGQAFGLSAARGGSGSPEIAVPVADIGRVRRNTKR